ncbi:mannose-6-phosphate isomerase, partial [Clostridium perfringens]|nr:mannose-6-phosphate isomerase [Clostridium perfringens]
MNFKYDKQPYVEVKNYERGHSWNNYTSIVEELKIKLSSIASEKKILLIDMYPGIRVNEVKNNLIDALNPSATYFTDELIFESNEVVTKKISDMMTDDRVFGKMCLHNFTDFIINGKLDEVKSKIEEENGLIIIYGV